MKLAFIGTGNMGGALACAASKVSDNSLILVNRHSEKAEKLRSEIGGKVCSHNEAAAKADFLYLGVKPVMLPELMQTLAPALDERPDRFVIVSMIAGVPISRLQEYFRKPLPIIRIMPNTPVSVCEGMILYSCSEQVTAEEQAAFLSSMAHAGQFLSVEERLMDAGMAVSGCGPAYVDLFVEALADGGVACGLPRKQAVTLAAQMVLGSAKLILESGKHPGELKDAVCSPGGTTIRGVRKLEEKGFRSAVMEAVIASLQ